LCLTGGRRGSTVSHWVRLGIHPLAFGPIFHWMPQDPLKQDGTTSVDVATLTQDVAASVDGGSYPHFKPRKPSLTWGLSTRKVTMISGKPKPTAGSPILANQAFSIGKVASQRFISYFLLRNKPATPARPRVHITKLPFMSSF
jgi:hypothetical protein